MKEQNITKGIIHEFNSVDEANDYLHDIKANEAKHWFTVPYEVVNRVSAEASILYGFISGFASTGYMGYNTTLSKAMKCSTRTITRLLNELMQAGCIDVVVVSKTRRLIYPMYNTPFIMDSAPTPSFSTTKKKSISKVKNNPIDLPNGGFKDLMDEPVEHSDDKDEELPF